MSLLLNITGTLMLVHFFPYLGLYQFRLEQMTVLDESESVPAVQEYRELGDACCLPELPRWPSANLQF